MSRLCVLRRLCPLFGLPLWRCVVSSIRVCLPPRTLAAHAAGATSSLREFGVIDGWRDELYPVTQSFHSPPLALVERAAAAHLGITVQLLLQLDPTVEVSSPLPICTSIISHCWPLQSVGVEQRLRTPSSYPRERGLQAATENGLGYFVLSD